MQASLDHASAGRPDDEIDLARSEPDLVVSLQPVDEALDVAFLAVKSAQQAARGVPASASAAKFRDEWHTSNLLVRQALRLVDERVQDLNRALKQPPRLG